MDGCDCGSSDAGSGIRGREVDELKRCISVLEDALAAFAPFAVCDSVDVVGGFRATEEAARLAEIAAFKRDTLYIDMSMFKRAAALTKLRG